MGSRFLSLDNLQGQEYGYELAYRLACEKLADIDIKQQCLKSDAGYQVIDSRQVITLGYLNRLYKITLPDIEVALKDSEEPVPLRDKILVLHYFIQAKGTPVSKKLKAYKELPGGELYLPTFFKRAIKPIVDHFGEEPHRLLDIAGMLGGRKADYGDMAVTINAFSRVPVTLVLWGGDEELAPQGNILFDNTVSDYLTTDDINMLCGNIAWKLVGLLKAQDDSHS
ncbi:DUF3786 domain-containing protein [Chloroflexota bacterium]